MIYLQMESKIRNKKILNFDEEIEYIFLKPMWVMLLMARVVFLIVAASHVTPPLIILSVN